MADVLDTTQQVVLSVRIRGDAGPQTGDVVLGGASFDDFQPTVSYNKNEVIFYDGALWRARRTMDPQPFDEDNWEILTDVLIRLKDFQPEHEYRKYEMCIYQYGLYRALNDFISGLSFNPSDWEEIDTVDTILRGFITHHAYEEDEAVAFDGKLYRAKYSFISTGTFNKEDWELISDLVMEDFQPNHDYHKNNLVIVGGALYRAKETFTSGISFDASDWEQLNAVCISGFEANTYYAKGSIIEVDGKIYAAKADFTSGAAFQASDWKLLSDSAVDDFTLNTPYKKGHIIEHDNQLYRAKADFTSGTAWNANDWEMMSPTQMREFEPNAKYYKNEMIVKDGQVYIAKSDFTTGSAFDENDWNIIAHDNLQEVYKTSSGNWINPTTVRPDNAFDEKIYVKDTNSYIENFTDRASGVEKLYTGTVISGGGRAEIHSEKSGATTSFNEFRATEQDAYIKTGVKRTSSYPYPYIDMSDNGDEEFKLEVNDVNSKCEMSDNVRKAVTDELCIISETQLGVGKVDGSSVKATADGVLSAMPVAKLFQENTKYAQYELVTYKNTVYAAKTDFTPTAWNVTDWIPVKPTITQYTTGATYSVGDLVYVYKNMHYDLYFCATAMNSAPATMVAANWHKVEIDGKQVYLSTTGNYVLGSTNAQDAYNEIDTQLYTAVRPYDDVTRYRIITQPAGSTPPAAISGCTTIVLYTE